jgi:hypothetical protein
VTKIELPQVACLAYRQVKCITSVARATVSWHGTLSQMIMSVVRDRDLPYNTGRTMDKTLELNQAGGHANDRLSPLYFTKRHACLLLKDSQHTTVHTTTYRPLCTVLNFAKSYILLTVYIGKLMFLS